VLFSDNSCILATGGGVIISPKNCEMIQKNNFVIWIYASFPLILQQLKNFPSDHRPALTNASLEKELESLYKEREPIYEKISHFIFHSDGNYQEQLKKIKIEFKAQSSTPRE
jgi:shikimate kinase